jgi:hypothetical protein
MTEAFVTAFIKAFDERVPCGVWWFNEEERDADLREMLKEAFAAAAPVRLEGT